MIGKLKNEIEKIKNEIEGLANLLNSINDKGQKSLDNLHLGNFDLRAIEMIEKIVIGKMTGEEISKLKEETKKLVEDSNIKYNKGKEDYDKYYGILIEKKNELSMKELEFKKAVNKDILDNKNKYAINIDKLKQAQIKSKDKM